MHDNILGEKNIYLSKITNGILPLCIPHNSYHKLVQHSFSHTYPFSRDHMGKGRENFLLLLPATVFPSIFLPILVCATESYRILVLVKG